MRDSLEEWDDFCLALQIWIMAHAPRASQSVHNIEDAAPVRGRTVVNKERKRGDYWRK